MDNSETYHFQWRQVTHSSRSMTGINKGPKLFVPKKGRTVKDKEARRAEILAELANLPYKLPGVND